MNTTNGKKRSKKAKASSTAKAQENGQPDDSKEEETDEGLAERFERELSWCVEQLQLGMETQNPDSKQAQEAMKILRILVNSKSPMIKKRQAMRTIFTYFDSCQLIKPVRRLESSFANKVYPDQTAPEELSEQAQEAMKILRILISSKAPMIKKRQAMRTTFGDYRAKMREQEKKSAAAAKKMKLLPVEDQGHQKSQFFRKSAKRSLTGGSSDPDSQVLADKTPKLTANETDKSTTEQQQQLTRDETVDNKNCGDGSVDKCSAETDALNTSFKFAFKLDDKALTHDEESHTSETGGSQQQDGCDDKATVEENFKFSKSQNGFRFNFSAVDDES